jgi:hypothetical protein
MEHEGFVVVPGGRIPYAVEGSGDGIPVIVVLFACGRYDEATPESTAELARLARRGRFEVLEGCSHMPLLEDPDTYLSVVRAFLATAEAGTAG